jgi:glycosyltransferase involved in cell wall biosynthesis
MIQLIDPTRDHNAGIRAVAILNPLGDYGINLYSAELAEGLAENGVQAHVYTNSASKDKDLPCPRQHKRFEVLGSVLFKQRHAMSGTFDRSPAIAPVPLDGGKTASSVGMPRWPGVRRLVLRTELAFYLKYRGYDTIWTQWPFMDEYGIQFWRLCRKLGFRVLHTVHNVLPHEQTTPDDLQHCRAVYSYCDRLIVHSNAARSDFVSLFPGLGARLLVSPLGLYTFFPRNPGARTQVRKRLGIGEDDIVLLFCGGIRPYKNIDSVLEALAAEPCRKLILVVAGTESHYSDASPSNLLGHTHAAAARLGVLDRVRLIPRHLSRAEMADLFEAGDILMLPLVKGYGSGMLLLGMTFGKQIVATPTGGAEEYLRRYAACTILRGSAPGDIVSGLTESVKTMARQGRAPALADNELAWPRIARGILEAVK